MRFSIGQKWASEDGYYQGEVIALDDDGWQGLLLITIGGQAVIREWRNSMELRACGMFPLTPSR